jgi:hypothetical protein
VLQCRSDAVMLECISVLSEPLVKSFLDSYVPQLHETLTEMATRDLHPGIHNSSPLAFTLDGIWCRRSSTHARAPQVTPLALLLVRSAAHGTPKKKVAPLAGVVQPTSHPRHP